jgi:hypothetical protein
MPVEQLAELMKKLSLPTLNTLVEGREVSVEQGANKTDIIDSLIDWCYETGIVKFINDVDVEKLKESMKEAHVAVDKSASKNKLREQFLDAVSSDERGLEGFLGKMQLDTLKYFVKLLDFETDASTKKQFADDIADEILLNGVQELFESMKLPDLKEAAKLIGVNSSGSKPMLLDRILNEAFPGILLDDVEAKGKKKQTRTREEWKKIRQEANEKIRANRPELKKGITRDEIFQNYWDQELKDFCVKHNLKKSGNKNELIKRILAYLEDPTQTGFKERKKRKDGPKTDKSAGAKKAKTD